MIEIYKKWIPGKNIDGDYWIRSIVFERKELRIILSTEEIPSKILSITFKKVYFYRVVDESGRNRLWTNPSFEGMAAWNFCTVTGSNLTHWLSDESDGIYSETDMRHYFIKTQTDVIDILSDSEIPEVSWLR